MKITALLDALNSALAEPFDLSWSRDSLRFLLVFTVIYAVVVIVAVTDQKNTRPGAEHGSAAWGDVFRLNKFYMDRRGPNLLLTQHFHIGIDGYKHRHNTNILIVGGSGAGKTRTYGVPNVLECACSMVITDPKSEILRKTGNLLKQKGYEVIVFDLINPAASFCYNPFVYVHDDREVLTLIENLIQNTTPSHSKSSDPFWEKSETALLQALMLYLLHEAPPEEQNFSMVMEMISAAEVHEDDDNYQSPLDILFERLEMREPDSIACKQYRIFKQAAGVVCSKRLLNQAVGKSLRTHNLKSKKGAQVMRKNEKITALYERLSRDDFGKDDDQQRESNSISNQKAMLEEFAARQGFTNIVHFTDDGISGTCFDRPGFLAMMKEVEAGNVEYLCIKDMSRMGRDYLKVGQIMEILRQRGVRLIAINDGVDSARGDDDFTPFRNIMNEYYARDTSRKIRSTFQSKGKSGKHLTGTVIYGYLWNEARDQWLVDPEAADVVKRIFAMTIDGYGPYQIASKLKEEKVLIPSAYLAQHGEGVNKNKTFKDVYGWGSSTICNILEKREYLGHTINFKTRKHFKDKKSHYVPEDEWTIFENTHEPIIDQQTFDLVQKIRGNVRRYPDGWGEAAPLTGLLYCADCGGKMYYTQRRAGAYSQKGKVSNLKEMNETFNYLRANGIYSLEDLESRVSEHSAATESLKKTLDEQTARMKAIKQLYDSSAAFQSLKPVYDGLQKIKFEKPRAKYKAEHEAELKQFYAARRKLTGEFPDGKVDMKKLTEEYDELEQAHNTTYGEFKTVRDDLHRLWKVKSCVDTAARFNERTEEQKLQNRPQTRQKKEELSR